MILDNSKTIISLRLKLFGTTIVFLTYIVLAYIARLIKFPLLGLSETAWTLILTAIYLFIAFLPAILNYQYIYYSDEGEKIILRYFTSGIVGGKKNSVEINKNTFSGYKLESKFFGLITSITLMQHFKEGVARYPSIYISALTKEERTKVLRSLNLYFPHE